MSAGDYKISVIRHNVRYAWDGTIGNNSTAQTGTAKWYTNSLPTGLAISGANAFVAPCYQERQPALKRFATNTPQTEQDALPEDLGVVFSHVATDGTRYYVANTGTGAEPNNYMFVAAFNVSDNSPAPFSVGQDVTTTFGTISRGVIDLISQPGGFDLAFNKENTCSGIAVQSSGDYLAVSHGGKDEVRVFSRTTGTLLFTFSVPNPGSLSFSPNGDLWAVCENDVAQRVVRRYTNLSVAPAVAVEISGLSFPMAVAVHPSNPDLVLVSDAGSSQQVKAFNNSGAAVWTLGVAGGYNATNGPAVANTKFTLANPDFFTNPNTTFVCAPLAVQADGAFWLYDFGTAQFMRFDANRNYQTSIQYLPGSPFCAVDPNNPTRVFGRGFIEYSIDYSKPLLPGNNSWKAEQNWAAGVPDELRSNHNGEAGWAGIHTVVTLSSGGQTRTFAMLPKRGEAKNALVELPASGPMRVTGLEFESGYVPLRSYGLYGNGDLRYAEVSGGQQIIYRQALTGFDGSGNPTWGSPQEIARMPAGTDDPASGFGWPGIGPWQLPITESGVVVSFDSSNGGWTYDNVAGQWVQDPTRRINEGFHLGGALTGGTDWLWKGAPAVYGWYTTPDGKGSFDLGSTSFPIPYGGNKVQAAGRHVVYGYHGEFWNSGQANQFMHFLENGHFVGQFGVPNDWLFTKSTDQKAGCAGNTYSPCLVKSGNEHYLYHNEESSHGGVHRWHLVGVNAIEEMNATGPLGSTQTLQPQAVSFPSNVRATPGAGQVTLNWNGVPGGNPYKVKYSTSSGGPYTQAGSPNGTHFTVNGLVNGKQYFFVVSANVGGVDSVDSQEILAEPLDPAVPAYLLGSLDCWGDWVDIDATKVGTGSFPLQWHSRYLTTGTLHTADIGSKGFIVFDWDGTLTGHNSNFAPGYGVTLGSANWQDEPWAITFYKVNGQSPTSMSGQHEHAPFVSVGNPGEITVTLPNNDWHVVTVVVPMVFEVPRNFKLSVIPNGGSVPAATFEQNETGKGRTYLVQFAIKTSSTLRMDVLASQLGAAVQAVFVDKL